MAWIQHYCGCGVGQQLQLRFDPYPGNLHMPWVWPYKDKKKKRPLGMIWSNGSQIWMHSQHTHPKSPGCLLKMLLSPQRLPEAGGKEWGRGSQHLMGTELVSEMMKTFQRWMVVTVAQQCQPTSYQWTVHLKEVKMIDFMLWLFYHH